MRFFYCILQLQIAEDRDMRILLVEDELVTARAMDIALRAIGAVVEHADTADEALELAKFYEYDIIVMDIQLPGVDGYEAVRRIRAERIDVPILIVSGLNQAQSKVKAFSTGADDFLTKPFDNTELVARIRAIVRRSKGICQPTINVGPLVMNLENREVTVGNKPIHLTGKEYAILELMAMRKGMILTKEAFLNHLYGGMDEPEIKIIDVFICKLRKKLAFHDLASLIVTIWGRGYMIKDPTNKISSADKLLDYSDLTPQILSQKIATAA